MNFEDKEGQELSERDYRGIVTSAESSILNIKKQLLTVQTLRSELARKDQIVSSLTERVITLERRESLQAHFESENKILIEKSQKFDEVLTNMRSEHALFMRQLSMQVVQSDVLKSEIEALVNELSKERSRSEKQFKETSNIRAQLVGTEEALSEAQRKNGILEGELRLAELASVDIRDDAKARCSNVELDLHHYKQIYAQSEKKSAECELRAENEGSLARKWVSEYDKLVVKLSEKQREVDHWRKVYSEQELVVDTLTGLTDSIRARQAQEDEDNRIGLEQITKIANTYKNELQGMKSAIRFLSAGAEQLRLKLSADDSDNNLTDLGLRNAKLVEISTTFKSSFHSKFNSSPVDLRTLLTVVCSLAEICNVAKEVQRKLILELQKTNESTEAAANLLQRMESKYISMKMQLKEGKVLAHQQQQKLGQYLNTINMLSAEKERADGVQGNVENKRVSSKELAKSSVDERNREEEVKSGCDTSSQRSVRGSDSSTKASTHESSADVTPLSKAADDEDVKMLRETLSFVEILALNATELEKRYSEVLAEKRLLKTMCAGYDQLKFDLSVLASSCVAESACGLIVDNTHNSTLSRSTEWGHALDYDRGSGSAIQRSALSSSECVSNKSSPMHSLSGYSRHSKRHRATPLTLRIVSIYVLASLRLKRILRNIRSLPPGTRNVRHSQRFIAAPQSVYEESLTRKFGLRSSLKAAPCPSLLEVIAADTSNTSQSQSRWQSHRWSSQHGGAHESLAVVRDALRSMSDAVTGLKAKELLLFLAESRYGEQQKELLAALGEAELALRERDPSSANGCMPSSGTPHTTVSVAPLRHVSAGPTESFDHFISEFVRQPKPDFSQHRNADLSRDDPQDRLLSSRHFVRSDGTSHLSNTDVNLSTHTVAVGAVRGSSHDEDRTHRREGKRDDDSNCGTCSSPPSTIIGEGDSVLGEIQKALYTPAAHRYPLSRNVGSDRVLLSSTPSFLSTSYASPLRESLERSPYNPIGTGVYSEKILAGDERHVSVALRAYAMSVAEDEKKAWHSPVNMQNYLHKSLPNPTLRGVVEPSALQPVRMFTEDEIVSKSQSPEGV